MDKNLIILSPTRYKSYNNCNFLITFSGNMLYSICVSQQLLRKFNNYLPRINKKKFLTLCV